MRRLLLAIVLVTLAVETSDGQGQGRKRYDRRIPFIPVVTHALTIDTPTANPVFTAAVTPMTLSGTASGPDADHVIWSNDRGGSGTASGVGAWSVTASAGSTTVFSDSMNCTTTTNLSSQIPQIGTGYSEVYDSAGTVLIKCTPVGYAYPDTSPAAGSVVIQAIAPNPSLSGNAFDFSVTVAGNPSANKRWGMVYRYSDSNNYCAVVVRSGGYNPDLYWVKKVAGVFSDIQAAINADQTTGDVIRLVRDTGSNVELFVNGVSKGTSGDTFCDDNTTLAVGVGALGGVATDTMGTDVRFDDITVIDPGGGASGITLQSGVNVITVTLKDASNVTLATDVLTVTYGVTDTTAPVCSIHTPTTNPTDAVASAAYAVAATCTDNVGVSAGTFTCTPASGTCTSASGSLDGTFGAAVTSVEASKSFTLSCAAAPGVLNTIVFTPADTAGNTPVSDSIAVTCTNPDSTAPVPVISTDGGAGAGNNFSTTSSSVSLAGTASDVGSGLDRIEILCASCTPSVTTAAGVNPWSLATLGLGVGANLITARAYDLAGNVGEDTITITRTVALNITTTTLSSVTQNVAMTSQTLTVVGGTSPYTWDNNSGGSSLGGGACTGLSISSGGVISGTPTTTGSCAFTAKVTDNVAATDTQALTIAVVAAGTGPHDFFNSGIVRSDFYRAFSLRPTGGVNCTDTYMGVSFAGGTHALGGCNPYFAAQLDDTLASSTRYVTPPRRKDANGVNFVHWTYDATIGGAYYELPIYSTDITTIETLGANLPSGSPGAGQECETGAPSNCIVIKSNLTTNWDNQRSAQIDQEIFTCDRVVGFDSTNPTANVCSRLSDGGTKREARMLRAGFGTTAAAHTSGATIARHTPGGDQQMRLPLYLSEGHTYLITYDMRFSPEWVGTVGNTGTKFWQLSTGVQGEDRLFETKTMWLGTSGQSSQCTNNGVTFDKATMISAIAARSYNTLATAPNVAWTDTNGTTAGDNITVLNALQPQAGGFCLMPNRWTRMTYYVDLRTNNYDLFTMWMGDEVATPVKLFDALEFSLFPTNNQLVKLWIEMNDTYPTHQQGTVDPFRLRKLWVRNVLVLMDINPTEIATPGSGLLAKPLP